MGDRRSASRANIAAGLVVGLLLTPVLTGCDSVAEITGPDPADAAESLAAGLSDGTSPGAFADVEFADQTPEQVGQVYTDTVEGLGDLRPSVTVGDVSESESADTASAVLSWSWPVGDREWSYQTEAPMALAGDAWQVQWSPGIIVPGLTDGAVLDTTTIGARRGPVVGADGMKLVSERPVTRFGIDRSRIPPRKARASALRLADLVDIDRAAYAKRVQAAGEKAFVEAIVYRREDVPPEVVRGYQDIPGAAGIAASLPLAPTRTFAAPILGTVGEVTAEMIEDEPEKYQLGDEAGLSGLQARYDDQLRGTPGMVVSAVGPDGDEEELFRLPATRGRALELTLDLELQQAAERLLADVGPSSAIVAIRPSTGDLVAAANGPGTNGYNAATFGQFAPGSTFKSVSALALLRAGLTPASTVPCTATVTVDGKTFKNYSDYPTGALGRIPLRSAVANSCNTAFISQAGKVRGDALASAAASLGLGVDHDLGFPAYFGSVEPAESETEAAADLIGQGRILASPMAMAAVIASIQTGSVVVPRLVTSVDVSPPDVAPLTRKEATALRSMLREVVTSGSGRLLADLPGPPAIAKTGTAEFERDGKVLTHAWMIGAQGDLAVAVLVDVGDSGSGTAGPLLEAFLRAALP